MKHTVIALFDNHAEANRASEALSARGFGRAAVHIGDAGDAGDRTAATATQPATPLPASTVIEGGTGVRGRLMDLFSNLFGVPDAPHAAHYEEAVRRGGALVSVHADDETQAASARDALLSAGAVNIDDRIEEWRQGGWDDGTTAATTVPSAATGISTSAAAATVSPDGLPRAAVIHRHEVSIGGVRIYGHGARQDDDAADAAYRSDYSSRYASQGGSYDDYGPAYRYGHDLASDARYGGRDWDDIEADARSDWESRHPGSPWERFKGAVRHAWERARTDRLPAPL